jgi:hypothetical protein
VQEVAGWLEQWAPGRRGALASQAFQMALAHHRVAGAAAGGPVGAGNAEAGGLGRGQGAAGAEQEGAQAMVL